MSAFNYIISITGDCTHTSAGAINLTPSGGTPPYTIEWYSPSLPPVEVLTVGSSLRTNLNYGVYAVRLNDSTLPVNGEFYVNIPVSSGVCVSILNIFDTTCGTNNGAVTGTSTSDFSTTIFNLYTIDDVLLETQTVSTSNVVFNNLSAGTYYITAEDLGGCTGSSQSFIVNSSNELDFGFFIVPNSACASISNPLGKLYITGQTGNPPYTYLWSNNTTGSTITGLTSGFYSVTVTDNLGCQKSKSAEIKDVDALGLVSFSANTPTCFMDNGSLTIFISGGTAPYYYSASTGYSVISYNTGYTFSNLVSGEYSFSVTDAGLCNIFVGTTLYTPNSINDITITTTNSTCSSTQGSMIVSIGQGIPPFKYTLIYPDSSVETIISNTQNQLFQNLSAGMYTVSVSNDGACEFLQDVYIMTSDLFEIYTSLTGTTCAQNNGVINIIKTPGGIEPFNYYLDNVPIILNTTSSAVTVSNVSYGNHIISVIDSSGCTQITNTFVSQSNPLEFSLFATGCGNGSEGSVTAFISSGTPPFVFNWSNNVLGNPQNITVNGLTGGTYSLTITDSTGCYFTQTTNVSCSAEKGGYYEFLVGDQDLIITNETNFGLLQMLNDGFMDLTDGDPNCVLNSATFEAIVSVEPDGLSASTTFYTSKTLIDVPTDDVWINSVTSLLLSIPGVSNVYVDPTNNQITIQKGAANSFLDNQIINFDIAIEYDISC